MKENICLFENSTSTMMMDNYNNQNVSVELLNEDIWREFNQVNNEMIITKNGRRMFPFVELEVRGLEQKSVYALEMEFVPVGEARLKFQEGKWLPSAPSEVSGRNSVYRHPESPNYGWHWMNYNVSFAKVKITNRADSKDLVVLNSHHKYCVEIRVLKLDGSMQDEDKCSEKLIKSFRFHLTEFIAVTAYQNEEVTALKIKYNPFAKAFQTNNRGKVYCTDHESRALVSTRIDHLGPANRVVTPSGLASYKRMRTSPVMTSADHATKTQSKGRISSLRHSPLQSGSNSGQPCAPDFGNSGDQIHDYSFPHCSSHSGSWTSRPSSSCPSSSLFYSNATVHPPMSSTPFTPSTEYIMPSSRTMPSPALPNSIKPELPQDIGYQNPRLGLSTTDSSSYFIYPAHHQQQRASCAYLYGGGVGMTFNAAADAYPMDAAYGLFPQSSNERTVYQGRLSSSSSEGLLDPVEVSWQPLNGSPHYAPAM